MSGAHHIDLVRAGATGVRSRPMRSILSAAGIAMGIAALVATVGISNSSKSSLLTQLDHLSNLLTVQPGQNLLGDQANLPASATGMIARIAPVTTTSATQTVPGVDVYRNSHIPAAQSNGIAVITADPLLLSTLDATIAVGTFLNTTTARFPTTVLGAATARALGISSLREPRVVRLGGNWFTVLGILDTVLAAPEIDRAALIGFPVANDLFGIEAHPTKIYVRTVAEQTEAVRAVLARTVNPSHPDQVMVNHPSDLVAAKLAAKGAYNALLLGLGGLALIVGGVGIANIMVIAVLERRSEIGLRRALGATPRHIGEQFVIESLLLSLFGGIIGSLLGLAATLTYSITQNWDPAPLSHMLFMGPLLAVAIGAVAGLYPALRAASLAPTRALRAT